MARSAMAFTASRRTLVSPSDKYGDIFSIDSGPPLAKSRIALMRCLASSAAEATPISSTNTHTPAPRATRQTATLSVLHLPDKLHLHLPGNQPGFKAHVEQFLGSLGHD